MARRDIYLDGMLRHLGAAYYDSLHGQATHDDVTRALDAVDVHLAQEGEPEPGAKAVRTGITEGPEAPDQEPVATAIHLMWDIDGVVDVDNRLGQPAPVPKEYPKAPHHLDAH